jgi:hypothetical protein
LLIDQNLRGQDPDDPEYRNRFNSWLNALWEKKDSKVTQKMKRMTAHYTGIKLSLLTLGG